MKETSGRIVAGILWVTLLGLTGCEAKEGDKKDSAKGRYLETEYALPEKLNPLCMKILEDGTIRLADPARIYDSKDNGETWKLSKVQFSQATQEAEEGFMSIAIHKDGSMFLAGEKSCSYIDAAGAETKVTVDFPGAAGGDEEAKNSDTADSSDITKMIYRVEFTKDGKVLVSNYAGMGYLIEPKTGEILKTFGEGTSISDFTQVGDRLLSLSLTGLSISNMETGNIEESEPALKDFISNSGKSGTTIAADDESTKLTASAKEEDTLYYCDSKGLHRYKFGSSDMELLINGSLASMGNPQNTVVDIVELEENSFLILYSTESGVKLMNYTYSKEAAAVPGKEIKVYALQDNRIIRQAIANFQKKNLDYYISLETGKTGDDSVTASDAIAQVNTNIMAGKGPDILLLDGMPVESYQKEGLLEDLTDVVVAVREDEVFFDKILSSEKTEDGLFIVPTRFLLPSIIGEEKNVNEVTDVKTLADTVEKLRKEDADISSIIGEFDRQTLTQLLLYNAIPQMMNKDGTINRDYLMEFLQDVKRMYDGNYYPQDEEGVQSGNEFEGYTDITCFLVQMMNHQQKMSIGTISDLNDFALMLSINDKLEWSYELQEVYVPQDIIGINAKSKEMEGSKAFVKYLLSEEMQASSQSGGFPVSADGLRKRYEKLPKAVGEESGTMSMVGEDGKAVMEPLSLRSPTPEELDQLIESIEKLSKSSSPKQIIVDSIISETSGYFDGEIEAGEAVDKILKAVNLHLVEQS